MAKKTASRKNRHGPRAKSIRKKKNPGAKSTEVVYHSTKEIKVEKELIENFIGLQKVMVNLANKFDNLSTQISKLLDLFEISAKALAQKELSHGPQMDTKQVMERLDKISEHAGLIGKGLALIHEAAVENDRPLIPQNARTRQYNSPQVPALPPQRPAPSTGQSQMEKVTKELEGYEKSKEKSEDGKTLY